MLSVPHVSYRHSLAAMCFAYVLQVAESSVAEPPRKIAIGFAFALLAEGENPVQLLLLLP